MCDDCGRQRFHASEESSFYYGSTYHYIDVPNDKRLVTQFISMRADLSAGGTLVRASAAIPFAGFDFVPRYVGRVYDRYIWVVSQPATLYVDGDSWFAFFAYASGQTWGRFRTSVSGYLLDCNDETPCN